MADHFRLLGDLLGHEVAVLALVRHEGRGLREIHRPRDLAVRAVADLDRIAGQHHPVAVLEIGHAVGEGGERYGVRAQIHLAVAMADGERRSHAGADHEIMLVGEQDGQREGAFEALQHLGHRILRRGALLPFARNHMRDDFGVGLGSRTRSPP